MAPKTNTTDKKTETVNTSDSIMVGNDPEKMLAQTIAAIPAVVTGAARDAIIAAAKTAILKSEADRREAEITAHIQWLVANGFRTIKTEKSGERQKCTCGVGRHTENTARCETYIAALREDIKSSKNEKHRDLLTAYLNRETAKAAAA